MTDDDEDKQARLDKLGRDWMARIEASKKYEEDWIDEADEAENAYLVTGDTSPPAFNILHSNVETMVPAVYNSTPAPDIRPRHTNNDPIGKVVCDILERAIATQIDDERLDKEIEDTAQDAFLAGRGVTRVRYEADMQDQILKGERVVYENVSWRDYREGKAKRWADVPWVAFRYHVYDEQLERMEGGDVSDYSAETPTDDSDSKGGVDIWQVWDRQTRKVITVTADNSKVVSIVEDPLQLPGFFPMPEPVQPIKGSGKRCPVCPYSVYKTLAKELDTQTKRINAITRGLKVRGVFAGDADIMEVLSSADDNVIVSVPDIAGMAATTKLDDAISWWPIDKAIVVLRELIAQREQTKAAIYEITGISDVVRGASDAAETAKAQEIKSKWVSLRTMRLQNMIARHVRDLFILTAEIMAKNFDPESVLKASGVPLQPQEAQQVAPMLQQIDHYRIDIESDSTVRADLTQKRGEMSEFLNGTAQFFSTMAPVVEQAPQTAAPMAELYASFARQFNLGKQAEDAVDQMAQLAKQVQPGGGEQQPDKLEMIKLQIEQKKLEIEQMKLQQDGQLESEALRIQAHEAGIKQGDLNVKQFTAQKTAQHREAEIALEATQQRPVGIG